MAGLAEFSTEISERLTQVNSAVVALGGRRNSSVGIHWRQGWVVTSCEAIGTEDTQMVSLPDGTRLQASLAGADASTDVAIFELPADVSLPVASVEETNDVTFGQLVFAVGRVSRRRGMRSFARMGLLSEVGESWQSQSGGKIDRYIRVGMDLPRGAAGCPLVNAAGNVIGFNTFGPRRSVLTIPASTVARSLDQLQSRGKISRGYLGLGMQAIPLQEGVRSQHNLDSETGIMVVSVAPESAADTAGMLLGDVMVAIDGNALQSLRQIQALLNPQSVGQTLEITFLRGGQLQTLPVTVGER